LIFPAINETLFPFFTIKPFLLSSSKSAKLISPSPFKVIAENLLSSKNIHKRKKEEIPILETILEQLNAENPIQKLPNFSTIKDKISNYQFITAKPIIGILNYNDDIGEKRKEIERKLKDYIEKKIPKEFQEPLKQILKLF